MSTTKPSAASVGTVHPAGRAENPYAGQGPVLLDIGGDIGALVVSMPEDLLGVEVEIRPAGPQGHDGGHDRHEGHRHEGHDHDGHGHDHAAHPHLPHVAVVARQAGDVTLPSLVFPDLREGAYELYQRPAGPVELRVGIRGGAVTHASWPA